MVARVLVLARQAAGGHTPQAAAVLMLTALLYACALSVRRWARKPRGPFLEAAAHVAAIVPCYLPNEARASQCVRVHVPALLCFSRGSR